MAKSAFRTARRAVLRRFDLTSAALALAAMLSIVPRCASAGEAAALPKKQVHSGVVGVWEGTSLAICPGSLPSRCNAEQKITLTLVGGERSQLGGFYKCAFGNSNCYNMNETGKIIAASVTGPMLRLRVLMPDGTSCMFNGRLAGDSVTGGYSCYTGGSLLERGSWQAKRAY